MQIACRKTVELRARHFRTGARVAGSTERNVNVGIPAIVDAAARLAMAGVAQPQTT
jgi:hypothetical protein